MKTILLISILVSSSCVTQQSMRTTRSVSTITTKTCPQGYFYLKGLCHLIPSTPRSVKKAKLAPKIKKTVQAIRPKFAPVKPPLSCAEVFNKANKCMSGI